MTHRAKSYPASALRKELTSLGIPQDSQDFESLKAIISSAFKSISFAGKDVDELAEILIYLLRKNLIDTNRRT
jgi:hypothetical protein